MCTSGTSAPAAAAGRSRRGTRRPAPRSRSRICRRRCARTPISVRRSAMRPNCSATSARRTSRGSTPTSRTGEHAAVVRELVDGVGLNALLREKGAIDPEPALAVLKGSLLGLAAAHEAGVVHRDHKPTNVLLTTEGSAKLAGVGVAVARRAERRRPRAPRRTRPPSSGRAALPLLPATCSRRRPSSTSASPARRCTRAPPRQNSRPRTPPRRRSPTNRSRSRYGR